MKKPAKIETIYIGEDYMIFRLDGREYQMSKREALNIFSVLQSVISLVRSSGIKV